MPLYLTAATAAIVLHPRCNHKGGGTHGCLERDDTFVVRRCCRRTERSTAFAGARDFEVCRRCDGGDAVLAPTQQCQFRSVRCCARTTRIAEAPTHLPFPGTDTAKVPLDGSKSTLTLPTYGIHQLHCQVQAQYACHALHADNSNARGNGSLAAMSSSRKGPQSR